MSRKTRIRIYRNVAYGDIRIAGTVDNPLVCLQDIWSAVGGAKGHYPTIQDADKISIALGSGRANIFVNARGVKTALKASNKPNAHDLWKNLQRDIFTRTATKTYTFTELAEELKLPGGATELIRLLHVKGILIGRSEQTQEFIVAPEYSNRGFVVPRYYANSQAKPITVWTETGRAFVMRLFEPEQEQEVEIKPVDKKSQKPVNDLSDYFDLIGRFDDVCDSAFRALGSLGNDNIRKHLDSLCDATFVCKAAILDIIRDISLFHGTVAENNA